MANGYIFGGDTGVSYDDLQRKRAILNQLTQRSMASSPQNVGEGLSALGAGLGAFIARKRLEEQERAVREEGGRAFGDVVDILLGRTPTTQSPALGATVPPMESGMDDIDLAQSGAAATPGGPSGAQPATAASPRLATLLQAAANPALNPQQRNIVGALLNRELSQSAPDPVTLAEGETLVDPRTGEVIASGREKAAQGFTLGPGQRRFGPQGRVIAEAPPAPKPVFEALTTEEKTRLGLPPENSYQRDLSTGRVAQIGGAQTTVNVVQPKLSADYKPIVDNQGNIIGAEPIPGTKAAREAEAVAEKTEKGEKIRKKTSDIVTTDVDRALGIIEKADIPVTGAAGIGQLLANVPGTDAADLQALLGTIRANAGFDQLQAMRDASPTGGALGAVSEGEGRRLESAIGNLEQSQSKEQLVFNLKRVRRIYNEIVHGPSKEDEGWTDIGGGVRIRRK